MTTHCPECSALIAEVAVRHQEDVPEGALGLQQVVGLQRAPEVAAALHGTGGLHKLPSGA